MRLLNTTQYISKCIFVKASCQKNILSIYLRSIETFESMNLSSFFKRKVKKKFNNIFRFDPVCFYLVHILAWFICDWILIHIVQVITQSCHCWPLSFSLSSLYNFQLKNPPIFCLCKCSIDLTCSSIMLHQLK